MEKRYMDMFDDCCTMGYCKADRVVSWHPSGPWTIMFRYEDGSEYEYNALDKTIHVMWQTDNDNLTDEETLVKFGYTLGRRMRAVGYDVSNLSAVTGISQATLYRYLRGEIHPRYFNVLKIAKALHCSPNEFSFFI